MKKSSWAQKCTTGAARRRQDGPRLLAAQMDVELVRTRFDGGQLHAAAAKVEHDVQLVARMLTGTNLQQLRGSHWDARGRVRTVDADDAEHFAHRRAGEPGMRVRLAVELAIAPQHHLGAVTGCLPGDPLDGRSGMPGTGR